MFPHGTMLVNSKPTLLKCSYCPLRSVLYESVCNRSARSTIYLMTPARPHSHVRVRRVAYLLPVGTAGRCSDISLRQQKKLPTIEVATNELILFT